MEEKLILADGTEIPYAHVMEDRGLWFYVQGGMTMDEVYQLMRNPARTERIRELRSGVENVFEGYVDLVSIRRDGTQVSGCLWRE